MSYEQVGLRISREAGKVPNVAQIGEGELAFNLADRRVFTRFGSDVVDITDHYTQVQVDQFVLSLSQRIDALGTMASRNIHVAERAPTDADGVDGDLWFQH